MNKNGFTLIELLAVLSLIGVVTVLLLPSALKTLNNSKKLINNYNLEELIDAGKMYVADLDNGELTITYTGSDDIIINGETIKTGTVLSGYDLKTYIIYMDGIDVNAKTLVENGYYNDGCVYATYDSDGNILTEEKNCDVPEDCTLRVGIEYKLSNDNIYYVTTGYTATIIDGCE